MQPPRTEPMDLERVDALLAQMLRVQAVVPDRLAEVIVTASALIENALAEQRRLNARASAGTVPA